MNQAGRGDMKNHIPFPLFSLQSCPLARAGLLASAVALFMAVYPLGTHAANRSLSYVDLVHRLTDLEYLATIPASGEQCAQWSSYDRRSRYDAMAMGSSARKATHPC